MATNQYKLVKELFMAVRDLSTEDQSAYLDRHCQNNTALRAEVQSLLDHDDRSPDSFLSPASNPIAQTESPADDTFCGRRIGKYHIRRIIDSGGMGIVYEAEQDQPRRRVAIKVIRLGLSDDSAKQRFLFEAEALGRLRHPAVAQVFEAGAFQSDDGERPYLVMELIEGETLLRHTEKRNLSIEDRVELLLRICAGVEHAHQNGVIHRDLKPTNIIVQTSNTAKDQAGRTDDWLEQPKIVDFGIARLIDGNAGATMHTQAGQLLGTLPYMSPEQVCGTPDEVDTRTDVYALGVTAYQLMAGRYPIDVESSPMEDAIARIRDDRPLPLSHWDTRLKGDLDTIIGKALEKDKADRYSSVRELAADLRRYLADEPISARPTGTWYRVRKFTRRHRSLVAVGAAFLLVLILGAAGTTWQAIRATRAAAEARLAEEEAHARRLDAESARAAESAERARAVSESVQARTVSEFLQFTLMSSTPAYARGRDTTVRNLLTEAESEIERSAPADADVESSIRYTIGSAYSGLGLYPQADRQLARARDLLEARQDQPTAKLVAIQQMHARVLIAMDRLNEADSLIQMAMINAEQLDDHSPPFRLDLRNDLIQLRFREGQSKDLLPIAQAHLEDTLAELSEDNEVVLTAMTHLGNILAQQGSGAAAEPYLRFVASAYRRRYGYGFPRTIQSLHNLALAVRSAGHLQESAVLLREVVDLTSRLAGENHPDTLLAVNDLGVLLVSLGELKEASGLLERSVLQQIKLYGPNHQDTLATTHNLAQTLSQQGDLDAAEPLMRRLIEARSILSGDEHPTTLLARNNLALLLNQRGLYREAEEMFRANLAVERRTLGPADQQTLRTINNLGGALREQGNLIEAEPLFEEAYVINRRRFGENHVQTVSARYNLGRVQHSAGRLKQAEQTLSACAEWSKKTLPTRHWLRATFRSAWGDCLTDLGRFDLAESELTEGYEVLNSTFGPDHERTQAAAARLARWRSAVDEAATPAGSRNLASGSEIRP
jgi:serine/threonine protein kinase